MKKTLIGTLLILGLGAATGAGLFQAGMIDVSADTPHAPVVHRLIEWARERSVARHSADIVPPADLADAGRIRRGAGNYDAMCAGCHLSPGLEDTEIRKGLYPQPPNLSRPAGTAGDADRANARRFWIIKHGIKASGMAAWSRGGMEDMAIWDLVALLQQLPNLSPAQYRQLVASSEGHSHGGMDHHAAAKDGEQHSHDDHAAAERDADKGHAHGHGHGHRDHAH